MDYDFGIMLCETVDVEVLTMEVGIKPNGKPIYRVALFKDGKWTDALYDTFTAALTTYKFLQRVQ